MSSTKKSEDGDEQNHARKIREVRSHIFTDERGMKIGDHDREMRDLIRYVFSWTLISWRSFLLKQRHTLEDKEDPVFVVISESGHRPFQRVLLC